ncbi:MAG: DUF2851 family protein [Bacteroidales bacterium]|nr:DUF2851 family protein [Bacteroidales bacterium]
MTEAFLHYIWQHQLLSSGLTTTDGQPVEVLRAGELNRDAGPDFFNARLRIGGMEWVGNVEIHISTSHWHAHHHSSDPAYNNIILHVVYEHDAEIFLQNGKSPHTLELKHWLHPSLVANYQALTAPTPSSEIPCGHKLPQVSRLVVNSMLDRLVMERMEHKSGLIMRMLEESRGDWERVCYWLMARYFGGKVNALVFELLAKATDPRFLARWTDNPERIEAILMGQAGLLEGYFEDDYPRQLQADYAALRAGANLNPIDGYLWKFYCLRPSSFPTIRISQFAHLMSAAPHLFFSLLPLTDVKDIKHLFSQQASSYWCNHYQFDQPTTSASTKRVGNMLIELLIINAWIPLLLVYGQQHNQPSYKDQALALLSQLPPEDNAIVRRWKALGLLPTHAAESQALLQLYDAYCLPRRCLECRIGFHILKRL